MYDAEKIVANSILAREILTLLRNNISEMKKGAAIVVPKDFIENPYLTEADLAKIQVKHIDENNFAYQL